MRDVFCYKAAYLAWYASKYVYTLRNAALKLNWDKWSENFVQPNINIMEVLWDKILQKIHEDDIYV